MGQDWEVGGTENDGMDQTMWIGKEKTSTGVFELQNKELALTWD